MKKLLLLPIMLFAMSACTQAQDKTAFAEQTLATQVTTTDGTKVSLKDALGKHLGKTVVIDVWASWCPDCIKGMPKVHKLQEMFPEVSYVFLSYDRDLARWKEGIVKYGANGDNYHVGTKMNEGAFSKDVNLDWIPRYMVLDKEGKIVLFKAVEADDEKLIEILKNLK